MILLIVMSTLIQLKSMFRFIYFKLSLSLPLLATMLSWQIHADETKSSLQFASRALRVKNCAHVNEVFLQCGLYLLFSLFLYYIQFSSEDAKIIHYWHLGQFFCVACAFLH